MTLPDTFFELVDGGLFVYAVSISLIYVLLSIFSMVELRKYLRKNFFIDHNDLLRSSMAPSVSLLAPAYNEGQTIIDNVKSLLSIQYNNYEVIIINDGSKDDTMEKLIKTFRLEKVSYQFLKQLKTKPVRGIYHSTDKAFANLTIVDKENGGKADALNVGLNISSKDLVACIDVDCIIEPDALLKMVKPFLEDQDNVIASGGVVRIANSCVVEEGRLIKVNLPTSRLARFQVLEYLRAFLLGRMAWSRLNGLMLISGAFGMFKREIAVNAGGYDTKTVGEDMELVVRMRAYMIRRKVSFRIKYIPDPLCWTEAPSSHKVLARQRNRWARGTFEVLRKHRYMFFNPKYKVMGLLSYPFWFFMEWLAPFVEVLGIVYFFYLWISGALWWTHALALLALTYCFALFISTFSLFAEEVSYYKYTERKDIWKMLLIAMMEPFLYHPKVVYWSLKGNFDLWKGVSSWGHMAREGFESGKDFVKQKDRE